MLLRAKVMSGGVLLALSLFLLLTLSQQQHQPQQLPNSEETSSDPTTIATTSSEIRAPPYYHQDDDDIEKAGGVTTTAKNIRTTSTAGEQTTCSRTMSGGASTIRDAKSDTTSPSSWYHSIATTKYSSQQQSPSLLERALFAGLPERPRLDVESIEHALRELESGRLHIDNETSLQWTPSGHQISLRPGISSSSHNVQQQAQLTTQPVVDLLWSLYMRAAHDQSVQAYAPQAEQVVRRLILVLCAQGLSTWSDFDKFRINEYPRAGTLAGTPLGYLLMQGEDPELIVSFLTGGYDTSGTILRKQFIPPAFQTGRWRRHKFGLSLLHLAAIAGSEITTVRNLLQAQTLCFRSTDNTRNSSTCTDDATTHEIVDQAINQAGLSRIVPYSKSLKEVVDALRERMINNGRCSEKGKDQTNPDTLSCQLQSSLPLAHVSRAFGAQVDFELSNFTVSQLLEWSRKIGRGPGVDFSELITNLPPASNDGPSSTSGPSEVFGHSNPIILAILKGKRGVLHALTQYIKHQNETTRLGKFARSMLRQALGAPSNFHQRSSLHLAALHFGQSDPLWNTIVEAELVRTWSNTMSGSWLIFRLSQHASSAP